MAGNKTITQRIAFVGGEEMEVQLKKIGDTGAYQFKRIQDAAENADLGSAFAKSIADFQNKFGSLSAATDKLGASFTKLSDTTKSMAKDFAYAGAILGGLAAGFLKLAADAGKAQENLENSAKAAGLSVKDYTSLRDAFKIAGVEGEGLDRLIQKMSRSIETHNQQARQAARDERDLSNQFLRGKIDANEYIEKLQDLRQKQKDQAEDSADAFDRLGIKIADFANNPKAAIQQITQALQALPDGIEKTNLEIEIFGKSGAKISAVGGSLEELEKEAAKFRVETAGFAVANKKLDDSFDHIGITIESLRRAFFGVFGGELARIIDAIGIAIVKNQVIILNFAESIKNAVLPVLSDFVHFIEDGFVVSAGRESAAFQTLIQLVLDFGSAVKLVFGIIATGFQAMVTLGDAVADLLKRLFGVETNGQILAIAAAILYLTGGLTAMFQAAVVGFRLFQVGFAAVSLIFSPGGLLILGLAAVAAAIVAIIAYWPEITKGFETFANSVTEFLQPVVDLWNELTAAIDSAIESAKSFFGVGGGKAQATSVGYAGGGHVRGPGTGTSDSIVARLSDGEHVTRAQAVGYYGTRFMDAINNMQIPKSVLAGLAGFANGGLVRVASAVNEMPRFADGGLVDTSALGGNQTGGHPLTLVIDGEKFSGMVAEDRTFDKLSKFAVRRSIQSAGRKPLWVS